MLVGTLETVLIYNDLNIRENAGEMVCLVDDNSFRMVVEECFRVSLNLGQCIGVLQTDVWEVWEQLTAQRCLARLARSCQRNDGQNAKYIRKRRC